MDRYRPPRAFYRFWHEDGSVEDGFQALKTEGPELLVVTVLPNTPAAAAGIIAGDVITEINGLPVSSDGQS
jgi:S1-C subfamily serine protease